MKTIESLEDRVQSLETMLNMKQDDWLEACKEIDDLEAKLNYIADNSEWIRDGEKTFIKVRVADGANLSCKAFRREALSKLNQPQTVAGKTKAREVYLTEPSLTRIFCGEGHSQAITVWEIKPGIGNPKLFREVLENEGVVVD